MAKFTSAVILAAGNGTRFGGKVKKQYVEILGIPAIIRTIGAFEECDLIDEIILVGDKEALAEVIEGYDFKKIAMIVEGGETRQESALLGFDSVSDKSKFVAIHDAARCLVTSEIIETTVKEAYKYRAAAAAHKSEDTVKICDKNGIIEETTDRDKIWLVQTPQVFMNDVYRAAAYMAKKDEAVVTDDCMLCERLGFEVKLVECGRENIKLTGPDDLMLCEAILAYREAKKEAAKKMRIGHGYDAHRFEDGKEMIIGGVTFDCPYGLMAHSDGDVLCHAICDALLGAAGLGDIGNLFPDNDMSYKNIYSMLLLEKVCEKVREAGFEIDYIDSTIIAQQPKMAPYIGAMRETVAKYANIPVSRYNVKATTEEKMGFTGRREGISAHAVCILKENR